MDMKTKLGEDHADEEEHDADGGALWNAGRVLRRDVQAFDTCALWRCTVLTSLLGRVDSICSLSAAHFHFSKQVYISVHICSLDRAENTHSGRGSRYAGDKAEYVHVQIS